MPDPADVDAITLLVLDVDGVLTDGRIHFTDDGREMKSFHVRDGLGIGLWLRLGHDAAIITGRSSPIVAHRARELGVRHVHQGVTRKIDVFHDVLDDLGITASETAVMGDDLPDLEMMRRSAYPITVADAAPEVRAVARFVTDRRGGGGAVREATEHLLRAKGLWEAALALHGPDS